MRAASLAPAVVVGALGCTPVDASCPASFFASAAEHVATTIKLNNQSDCAGYARVTNTQGWTPWHGSSPRDPCAADPSDGACIGCLRPICCPTVVQACQGEATVDAATCATFLAVRGCIQGALADPCETACGGAS